jgi:cation transport ATPase
MATSTKVNIGVSGMTCASCSARVQRALEKQPGVQSANVNLMTNNATVEFDASQTNPQSLATVIEQTGYKAELPTPGRTAFDEQQAQDEAHTHEYKELRGKAITALIVAAVMMGVSMAFMHSAVL